MATIIIKLDSPDVFVERDEAGERTHIDHSRTPVFIEPPLETDRQLADLYVQSLDGTNGYNYRPILFDPKPGNGEGEQPNLDERDREEPNLDDPSRLVFAERKYLRGTSTITYAHTLFGLDVWESGLTVTVQRSNPDKPDSPLQIISSEATLHRDLNPDQVLKPRSTDPFMPKQLDQDRLAIALNADDGFKLTKINHKRLVIYRYDPRQRVDPPLGDAFGAGDQIFKLPPIKDVPFDIIPGRHYMVSEALFTTPLPDGPDEPDRPAPLNEETPEGTGINWRAFVEVTTGAVLFIRPFVAGCMSSLLFPPPTNPVTIPAATGPEAHVFCIDPMTQNGSDPLSSFTPGTTDAQRNNILQGFTTPVSLINITPVSVGVQQPLNGKYIKIKHEVSAPRYPDPTQTVGSGGVIPPFNYAPWSQRRNFTSVNAYYHCNAMFRMMENFGYRDIPKDYFKNATSFPISVDPMGTLGSIGAYANGDTRGDGVQNFLFGSAQRSSDFGNATDVRVVLHEFCHALLYASVHSANLGFAHSAGDSLAAILCDPGTSRRGTGNDNDRYSTFPWISAMNRNAVHGYRERFHGGDVDGRDDMGKWGWGGTNDRVDEPDDFQYAGGYFREQILSMTMFRIYQALGGDADPATDEGRKRQRLAARFVAYLIIQAIGSQARNNFTPVNRPGKFANKLVGADLTESTFPDFEYPSIAIGAAGKVIRWGFEQQGLQFTTDSGAPPTDVYINDGRNGDYRYTEDFCQTEIWNRVVRNGAMPTAGNISPPRGNDERPNIQPGFRNYLYVRVNNKGITPIQNVRATGYSRKETALGEPKWDGQWTQLPTTTPSQAGPFSIPGGGHRDVGPFEWTPGSSGDKVWVVMSVSADGDASNIEARSPAGPPFVQNPIQLWWLVPFDNNLAHRRFDVP